MGERMLVSFLLFFISFFLFLFFISFFSFLFFISFFIWSSLLCFNPAVQFWVCSGLIVGSVEVSLAAPIRETGAISVMGGRRCMDQAEGRTDGRPQNRTVSTSAFVGLVLSRAVSRKTRGISFACSIERLWQCCLYPTPACPAVEYGAMLHCYEFNSTLWGIAPLWHQGAVRLWGEFMGKDRVLAIYIKNQAAVGSHTGG